MTGWGEIGKEAVRWLIGGGALAAERVRHLGVQRLLDEQTHRQPDEARARCRPLKPSVHQRAKLVAGPVRCLDALHRDAPWGTPAPTGCLISPVLAGRLRPNPFFQDLCASTRLCAARNGGQ
jgi:hypothetical protein